jgi:hypothetical protein
VPTYKWMQVKRNVPKPAGKDFSWEDILEKAVANLVVSYILP